MAITSAAYRLAAKVSEQIREELIRGMVAWFLTQYDCLLVSTSASMISCVHALLVMQPLSVTMAADSIDGWLLPTCKLLQVGCSHRWLGKHNAALMTVGEIGDLLNMCWVRYLTFIQLQPTTGDGTSFAETASRSPLAPVFVSLFQFMQRAPLQASGTLLRPALRFISYIKSHMVHIPADAPPALLRAEIGDETPEACTQVAHIVAAISALFRANTPACRSKACKLAEVLLCAVPHAPPSLLRVLVLHLAGVVVRVAMSGDALASSVDGSIDSLAASIGGKSDVSDAAGADSSRFLFLAFGAALFMHPTGAAEALVEHLLTASPSTASRAGDLFVALIESWVAVVGRGYRMSDCRLHALAMLTWVRAWVNGAVPEQLSDAPSLFVVLLRATVSVVQQFFDMQADLWALEEEEEEVDDDDDGDEHLGDAGHPHNMGMGKAAAEPRLQWGASGDLDTSVRGDLRGLGADLAASVMAVPGRQSSISSSRALAGSPCDRPPRIRATLSSELSDRQISPHWGHGPNGVRDSPTVGVDVSVHDDGGGGKADSASAVETGAEALYIEESTHDDDSGEEDGSGSQWAGFVALDDSSVATNVQLVLEGLVDDEALGALPESQVEAHHLLQQLRDLL